MRLSSVMGFDVEIASYHGGLTAAAFAVAIYCVHLHLKSHLYHLPPVPQRRGWEVVLIPVLMAGVVLLGGLGGDVWAVVPADGGAVELQAGAAHVAGGDFQIAQQGGPVPVLSYDSVFHVVVPLFGGLCAAFFLGSMAECLDCFSLTLRGFSHE